MPHAFVKSYMELFDYFCYDKAWTRVLHALHCSTLIFPQQLTPTLQVLLRATVALSCPQIARYPFCQSHLGSLAWRGVRRGVWSSLTLSPSLPHPLCLALQPILLPLCPTHFLSSGMEMVVPITAMIPAHHSTNTRLSSLSMESHNQSSQWAATGQCSETAFMYIMTSIMPSAF